MKKKNGFVFMETIVVICALAITLSLLFASYSYILRKSRERNTFDTTEMIYKTYYVKSIIDGLSNSGVQNYIIDKCKKMGTYESYVCDLKNINSGNDLYQIKEAFEVEKFYLVNPHNVLSNKDWLWQFDATTIDYINKIGQSTNDNLLIVKYKKTYNKQDETYEIFHSSVVVK